MRNVFAAILLAATAAFPACAGAMPEPVNQKLDFAALNAILARQAAAWEKHNFALGAGDWLPDAVLTSPGGQVKAGELSALIADYSKHFSNLQVRVTHVFLSEDGTEAAIEWDWEVTRLRDSTHGITHDAILVTFEGNKIKSWREYFDLGDSVDAQP